jgi:hypothetical protein
LGLWQFWLKEIKWPAQAPVNLTAELSIKDAGSGAMPGKAADSDDGLQAIELEVTARNPSTRPIYLLNNIWVAYGIKIDSGKLKWMDGMEVQLNGDHRIIGGKHYSTTPPVPVAVGNVFTDTGLQPNEKIVRSFVFYVPRNEYDYVEVNVGLPTTTADRPGQAGKPIAEVKYALRPDRSSYRPIVYRIRSGGSQAEASEKDENDIGLQWAIATRMLSLWGAQAGTLAGSP